MTIGFSDKQSCPQSTHQEYEEEACHFKPVSSYTSEYAESPRQSGKKELQV